MTPCCHDGIDVDADLDRDAVERRLHFRRDAGLRAEVFEEASLPCRQVSLAPVEEFERDDTVVAGDRFRVARAATTITG